MKVLNGEGFVLLITRWIGLVAPEAEIQTPRFNSQVNSGKLLPPLTTMLGQAGCEHHNTIPRFQPGGSESTLIRLLSLARETADFQR